MEPGAVYREDSALSSQHACRYGYESLSIILNWGRKEQGASELVLKIDMTLLLLLYGSKAVIYNPKGSFTLSA